MGYIVFDGPVQRLREVNIGKLAKRAINYSAIARKDGIVRLVEMFNSGKLVEEIGLFKKIITAIANEETDPKATAKVVAATERNTLYINRLIHALARASVEGMYGEENYVPMVLKDHKTKIEFPAYSHKEMAHHVIFTLPQKDVIDAFNSIDIKAVAYRNIEFAKSVKEDGILVLESLLKHEPVDLIKSVLYQLVDGRSVDPIYGYVDASQLVLERHIRNLYQIIRTAGTLICDRNDLSQLRYGLAPFISGNKLETVLGA